MRCLNSNPNGSPAMSCVLQVRAHLNLPSAFDYQNFIGSIDVDCRVATCLLVVTLLSHVSRALPRCQHGLSCHYVHLRGASCFSPALRAFG